MIGEGYHAAITQREFYQLNKIKLFKEYLTSLCRYFECEHKLDLRLQPSNIETSNPSKCHSIYPEELWVHYYKAYLDMYFVLEKYSSLSKFLWEIGYEGVSDVNYDRVTKELPKEYKYLVSNETVYDEYPMDMHSLNNYKKKSYFYTHMNTLLKNDQMLNILISSMHTIRVLKNKVPDLALFRRDREV